MIDPIWIPVITAVAVALIGGGYATWRYRIRRREPLPPTWPEMWAHSKNQDEKIAALGRMLLQVLDEWPAGSARPRFRAADIKLLEETIPVGRLRSSREG